MSDTKIIRLLVAGQIGPYQLDTGPILEAIADRLKAGDEPALAYRDETGAIKHGTLDPKTVEIHRVAPDRCLIVAAGELDPEGHTDPTPEMPDLPDGDAA